MCATPTARCTQVREAQGRLTVAVNLGLLLRVCLVPLFVNLFTQFSWVPLRHATSRIILWLSSLLGLDAFAVTTDTILVQSEYLRFVPRCTMMDAYFGAIPLLWGWRVSLMKNAGQLARLFVVVFVVNIVRLQLDTLLHVNGVPRSVSHEAITGAAYWVVLAWVLRHRAWEGERVVLLREPWLLSYLRSWPKRAAHSSEGEPVS